MSRHFVVILAGGKGERFWPLSRRRVPKQLLPIVGTKPMLTQTFDRVAGVVPMRNIYVITNVDQATAVHRACPGLPRANVIAEPVGRDSAAAVGLAAEIVGSRDPGAVFASVHSDAAIHDTRAFRNDLKTALAAAEQAPVMVTIGVKPDEPSTAFGYIQRGRPWRTVKGNRIFKARRFVEKPPPAVARRYFRSGDYYWNTGMFVWSVQVVREAFARNAPKLNAGLVRIREALAAKKNLNRTLRSIYPTLPKIAVDYALLEKAENVVLLPASFDWDDVGSWPAVARHHEADSARNVLLGLSVVEAGRGNIVVSDGLHLTAVLGVDDLVVVHTRDATLVCPRSRTKDIKQLLSRLAADPSGSKFL